jgi:hypothetical protein
MDEVLVWSVRGVEILCGLSLCLQTLEFLCLQPAMSENGVWGFDVQGDDLAHASPWLRRIFTFLARPNVYRWHLVSRLLAGLLLMIVGASAALMVFLVLSTVQILIRWRGAFNGGSDFMTLVVLIGLLIGALGGMVGYSDLAWRAGLLFIAIHAASSYFISGGVKLLNPEWRSGEALGLFLDSGIYGPLAKQSVFWSRPIAILCSWAFILWEIAVPLAFAHPLFAIVYCGMGLVFHFLVFWYFGLNRFFFAWLATYPAMIFMAVQLN